MSPTYAINPEYCGLVIGPREGAELGAALAGAMESTSCEGLVLQSSHHVIAYGRVGLHPESLFSALSSAHGAMGAQTSVVGQLGEGRLELGQPCMVFRIPMATAMSRELITDLQRTTGDAAVILLDPFDGSVWAIAPSIPLLDADELSALVEFEFDGSLVVTAAIEGIAATATPRSATAYDPLGAQLNEILNSQSEWLLEESSRIEEASRSIGLGKFGQPVASVTQSIVSSLVERGRLARQSADDPSAREAVLRLVDSTALTFQQLAQLLAGVRVALVDNGASPVVHGDARHSGKTRKATILAANALAAEFGDRLGECAGPPFLVSYGQYFTASQISRWLDQLENGAGVVSQGCELPDLVTLPDWCAGRLGALPVLAHEAGHIATSGLGEEVYSELFRQVESLDASSAWRDQGGGKFDKHLNATEDLRQHFHVLCNWADELAADLIACALCGPAFLFAFARFALGTLHTMGSEDESVSHTHPPTSSRLRTCEWALQQWGFDVQLQSTFLPDGLKLVEDVGLLQSVREIVSRPYGLEEHAQAVGATESALHRGELLGATPPTVLLNALWHSVVDKTGYANEVALAYALLVGWTGDPTNGST